jgi:sortase A
MEEHAVSPARRGGLALRRLARVAGTACLTAGALALVWAIVVWRWQDPLSALYTTWQQHLLASRLAREQSWFSGSLPARTEAAGAGREVAAAAARFRRLVRVGDPIGRIVIPRLGLDMVVVDGTDESALRKGPGRDVHTFMPGQDRLVYIAGHRTTYLAPFAHIDAIRAGDRIRLKMPYGTFLYRATRHVIVPADDLSVLRSPRHELLALQACHPRFFATDRYIVYARLISVRTSGGHIVRAAALAAADSKRRHPASTR